MTALFGELRREAHFMLRDRAVWIWTVTALVLASFAVAAGMAAVAEQEARLARLAAADQAERAAVLEAQQDWGGAAYYSFHLTAAPPSNFAFAAMGHRDLLPWQHRIRMLALEGQIYERDVVNPVLALVGRFDYAFLVAFVAPLMLIVMLHDLQARERAAGRFELLTATAGGPALWALRGALRSGAVLAALLLPLIVGAVVSGAGAATLLGAVAAVTAHVAFWSLLALGGGAWRRSAPVILAALLGVWLLLAVLVPAGARALVDRLVPVPSGADILLTQREAVNDAWDLPKETTMTAFLARHPEWSADARVDRPFEWKWYYAFQQVGDQQAEALAEAYRAGRLARDRLSGRVALLSPPALLERALQHLAGTDLRALLAYEDAVRRFHARLRAWYYPKLFRDEPFDRAALQTLPTFADESGSLTGSR